MNRAAIIRKFVKMFPINSLVRKAYNEKRVNFYKSKYMCTQDLQSCLSDSAQKKQILEKYRAENQKTAELYIQKFHAQLSKSSNRSISGEMKAVEDEMLFCKFAYGFEPDEFLCYGLENMTHHQRTAFVSDVDLMHMVYQLNDRIDIQIFNDKAQTYERFKEYYGREIITISVPSDFTKFEDYVARHPVFVKKNVFEAMGRSIARIDMSTCGKTARQIFDELIAEGKHVIEECVIQSEEMASFNSSSVNTIRCITFHTRDGVTVPYCFIKVGRAGSFVDNGGAGGILAGIDNSTGRLNTDGFDEFSTCYIQHPDSGKVFNGAQIPDFDQALKLAAEMSAQMPSVKFIGWDLAHTNNGWVVIEGNGMSQLIGPQIVFRRGVKQEVQEILKNVDLIV